MFLRLLKKCLAGDAVKVYSGEDGETKYVSYAAIGNAIYSLDSVEDYSDLLINGSDDNIEILSGFIPVLKGVEVI